MEIDEKKNIELWKFVEKTDEKFLKDVEIKKRKFKSIDAHSQILQATKVFGSYGKDWGIKDETFITFDVGEKKVGETLAKITMCKYCAILFYPGGEYPINSSIKVSYIAGAGYQVIDDDFAKKVSTDAMTKGLSKLGFNADVFMGAFDGNKYDYEGIENIGIQGEPTGEQIQEIADLKEKLRPDQKIWVDKEVNKGLNEKTAKVLIGKIKGVL